MADNVDNVIQRVKKLLALAKNNTSEKEMQAAVAAVDRILQAHRITMAQVEAAGDKQTEELVVRCVSKGGRRTAWRETLLHALTAHYGSCWYLSSHREGGEYYRRGREGSKGVQSYTVIGQESDVVIVEYMYTYLTDTIAKLGKFHSQGKGVKYGVGWLAGCAQGVSMQFSDMRIAARAQAAAAADAMQSAAYPAHMQQKQVSSALAVLDKRVDAARAMMKEKVGTKSAAAIHGARDYGAVHDGFGVGKTIPLNAGLGAGSTAPKLTS